MSARGRFGNLCWNWNGSASSILLTDSAFLSESWTLRAARDPRAIYDEHLRIIDALSRNMPDDAERFARQHMLEGRLIIEQEAARDVFIPKWVVNTSG